MDVGRHKCDLRHWSFGDGEIVIVVFEMSIPIVIYIGNAIVAEVKSLSNLNENRNWKICDNDFSDLMMPNRSRCETRSEDDARYRGDLTKYQLILVRPI